MKIKQTLTTIILILGISCGIGFGMFNFAEATSCGKDSSGNDVQTSVIDCSADNQKVETSGIWQLLLMVLNILTALVGIGAVGGIVYSGILYASAGGSSEQTKKALEMIFNIVIGIVVYALMFALLNYLVPGGLFNVNS